MPVEIEATLDSAASSPKTGIDESVFQHARIGDLEMAWIEARPPVTTARVAEPPLVLVHGFTGHRDDWIEVLPLLGARRRTIAVDLRGHGDSRPSTVDCDYSFEQHVKDLYGLLEHLGVKRCDLLGHSVGGMIVLRFALAHPAMIRSLVFMNTAPETPPALSRDAWQKATEIAEAKGIDFLQTLSERVGRDAADPILATWGERYWKHQRRRLCAMTPESYRGVGTALFDSESLVPRLHEIERPSLVLVGESDHEFLPGAALFDAHLSNSTRVTIPDSGHHPHQENTTGWLEALEAFLARVGADEARAGASG